MAWGREQRKSWLIVEEGEWVEEVESQYRDVEK